MSIGLSAPIILVGSMAVYAFAPNPNDWLLAIAVSCQALGWAMIILSAVAVSLGRKAIKLTEDVLGDE